MNFINAIILGLIVLTTTIAIGDYLWYGKKLKGWNRQQIIFFYFTRTLGELIAFTLGFILAWKLNA